MLFYFMAHCNSIYISLKHPTLQISVQKPFSFLPAPGHPVWHRIYHLVINYFLVVIFYLRKWMAQFWKMIALYYIAFFLVPYEMVGTETCAYEVRADQSVTWVDHSQSLWLSLGACPPRLLFSLGDIKPIPETESWLEFSTGICILFSPRKQYTTVIQIDLNIIFFLGWNALFYQEVGFAHLPHGGAAALFEEPERPHFHSLTAATPMFFCPPCLFLWSFLFLVFFFTCISHTWREASSL